jgi:hypothetical protein
VVEELLVEGVQDVIAIVRDHIQSKGDVPNPPKTSKLSWPDLTNEGRISVLKGVDTAIWCATEIFSYPRPILWKKKN